MNAMRVMLILEDTFGEFWFLVPIVGFLVFAWVGGIILERGKNQDR